MHADELRARALVAQQSGSTRELLVADSGASNNTDQAPNVAHINGTERDVVVCETAGGIMRAGSGVVRRPYTGLSPGLPLPGPRNVMVTPSAAERARPRLTREAASPWMVSTPSPQLDRLEALVFQKTLALAPSTRSSGSNAGRVATPRSPPRPNIAHARKTHRTTAPARAWGAQDDEAS